MRVWPLSVIKLGIRARWLGARGFGLFLMLGVLMFASRLGAVSAPVTLGSVASAPGDSVTMNDSIKLIPAGPQPALVRGRTPPHITRNSLRAEEASAVMNFNVSLKMRNFAELQGRLARGETISPAEMADKYLPLAADYNATANWLRQQGFVIEPDSGGLMLFARGTVAQVRDAFQVSFARVATQDGEFSSAVTAPSVPASLAPALMGINGLQPHLRKHPNLVHPDAANGVFAPPYFPKQIAQAYGANSLTQTGSGQTIAIVMDAFPKSTDLTKFWNTCSITQSTANIANISVGAGPPTGVNADTLGYEEVCLDVEWSSSIASAAKVRVYGVNGLDETDLDLAYQQIYTDAANNPQLGLHVVSLSYGGSEGSSAQLQTDDALFAQLASAGVTVFASSGDNGSTAGAQNPASDPNVTGVGGTSITLNTATGAVTSETGWSGSGGGMSQYFTLPTWQTNLGQPAPVPFRTVPDIAAPADPGTGCLIVVNGSNLTVGGTSWSTPTWAGFCTLFNQLRISNGLTSLGLLNPKLYPLLGTANFRDITSGSNGSFSAVTGYDMVTGIGVPNVATLSQTLSKAITPPSAAEVLAGQNAVFALPNTGSGETTFQWQRCLVNSSTWSNLTDNATYNGSATATLTINATTAAMDGDQFQCVISLSAGGSGTSPPAALIVVSDIYVSSTVAGQVGVGGTANGTGMNAQFNYPNDPAVDSGGNIFVADFNNFSIRKISPAGSVSTFAGSNGNPGDRDGIPGAARFNEVNAVFFDATGNLYVADSGNDLIRKVLPNGNVSTIAGEGGITGTANGSGNLAQFNFPSGVAVDASGNIFVADTNNHLIRKITVSGGNYTVSTLAGNAGVAGFADGTGTSAKFNFPSAIAVDASGNLYVADAQNNAIRKVTQGGVVTTLAGHPPQAGLVDGTGSFAYFNFPSGITVDASGNIYVTDTDNNTIRKVTPAGVVSTVLGQPAVQGAADGVSTSAQLNAPYGLCISSSGAIIIADTNNDLIREAIRVFAPQIQTAPQSQAVLLGQNATFTLVANGTATLNYVWQTFSTGNGTWTNLANNATFNGATTPALTINSTTLAMNGEQLRCLVSNAYGSVATSSVTLSVLAAPVFTTQPVSATATAGGIAQFNVAASGSPVPTYQWQVLPSGASNWLSLTDNATYVGSATPTLTVTAASSLNGAQFSCVASNGISPNATSQAALLTVYPVGYIAWAASLNLAGGSALPTATPFADTLPNLARFAMGIGAVPTAGQLPALSTQVVNGTTYLRLDYNVSNSLSGLQVIAQYSYDLQTWQPLSNSAIAQLADLNAQTTHYQASVAIPASGTVFLRLVVKSQ